MKKKFLGVIAIATIIPFMASCGGGGGGQKEDTTKAQIYVEAFDAGFGVKWLTNCMERFQEKVKDKDYGNGKKGVEFHFNSDFVNGPNRTPENLKTDDYTIYFDENANYNSFYKNDAIIDISEAISNVSPYDNKKVVDKLNAQQKSVYVREGTKYFGLPYYSGTYGLVYKRDIFRDNKLYLKEGKRGTKSGDWCDGTDPSILSAGPDGDLNTAWDNGLPATYAEFANLLKRMRDIGKDNLIPLLYNKHYRDQYFGLLTAAACVQDQGREATLHRLQMEGEIPAGELIDVDTLEPDTKPTTITNDIDGNGYELWRQKGMYDALQFMEILLGNEDNHVGDESGGASHYTTQENFIKGEPVGEGSNRVDCAMYNDGTWFLNECTKGIANFNKKVEGDNLGFMPLPRADDTPKGKYNLIDTSSSLIYLANNDKNKDPSNRAANLDFLNFIYSDGELQEFSLLTDAFFGVKYEMTDEQYNNGLTNFGKSVYDMRQSCGQENIVYTISTNYFYSDNNDHFNPQFSWWVGPNEGKQPIAAKFIEEDYTAEKYFKEMNAYYSDKGNWSAFNRA